VAASTPSRILVGAVLTAWLAVVVGPPIGLYAWRGQRLAEVSTPEARRQWEAFREDVRRQAEQPGPVKRKVPKSVEPPELVWLRDYAPLAATAWVVLAGVLGGVLAAMVIGVARSAAQQQPARDRDHEEQHDGDGKHADERKHG
jgi:hypothetical protein